MLNDVCYQVELRVLSDALIRSTVSSILDDMCTQVEARVDTVTSGNPLVGCDISLLVYVDEALRNVITSSSAL